MEIHGVNTNANAIMDRFMGDNFDPAIDELKFVPMNIKTKMGGICDVVGSGKTLMALAIAGYDLEPQPSSFNNGDLIQCSMTTDIYTHSLSYKITLIVVPHTILAQWRTTINDQTTLRMIVFTKKITKIENVDIILVSSTMYKDLLHAFPLLAFKRAIFDEADSINIPKCQKPPALFYWFMTATHQKLIYSHQIHKKGFIRDTFDQTDAYIKQHVLIKNKDDYVKLSFYIPDYNDILVRYKHAAITSILQSIVSERVQTMICAGDIQGAIDTFGLDTCHPDNIIDAVCQDLRNKLITQKANLVFAQSRTYSAPNGKMIAVKRINEEINKLENSIASIKKKIKESTLDPITYCEIENPVIMTCCKSVFDFESITIYLTLKANTLCPICRTPITKKNMVLQTEKQPIIDGECMHGPEPFESANYDKIGNVKHLINDIFANNSKIIVFSEFDASVEALNALHIDYKEVKGTSAHINKVVEWFNVQSDKRKVLFMNSRFCCAGLNLQACTDMIIYHKMSDSLITQIIGRAQRYGRTMPLNVYSFDD